MYAADIGPNFVALATWDNQLKVVMMGTSLDKLGLTKDGKSVVGPICSLLLAYGRGGSHRNGGNPTGRTHPPAEGRLPVRTVAYKHFRSRP